MRLFRAYLLAASAGLTLASAPALAADEFQLTIKDHKFDPAEVKIPAGRKVKLVVRNQDATAEEFESFDLNREKVVAPGGQIDVWVGPLAAGRYEYFGDFHPDTARGHIVAE